MKCKTFQPAFWLCSLLFLFLQQTAFSQTITVQGKVSSAKDQNGIPGVTVSVPGTSNGTVSDASGHYKLSGVSPTDSLAFSFVGYETKTVPVNGQKVINITLSPNVSELNQLVVIGYGTAKKKDLTGAISSVDASELQNQNPTSVQDILRSNVPGLSVGFSAGAKPDGDFQIRGDNTLNAGSSPLIVLDGVIYYGSLSDINPYDIKSIDVLKDASAAAVYGAKAANGVIAITTKSGKKGKPVINFNANISLATMEVNQPVYQGQDFINWRVDVENSIHGFDQKPYQFNDPRKLPSNISVDEWLAYDASNGDPVNVWLTRLNFKPIEIKDYKLGKTIDWYDMVFQNGLQQNYTLSLSGASDRFNYYWSGGYLNNEGIIVGDKYSTIQSRLKLKGEVTDWFTVGINTQFADRDESAVPVDWKLMWHNSPYGSMYNDDSTDYRYSPQDDQGGGSRNPLAGPKYTDRLKKYYTLNSVIYGEIKLPFGIKYRVNFTPQLEWYRYFNHQSSKYDKSDAAKKGGIATREEHFIYHWQIDNILSWSKTFNKIHHFDVTLLANAEKYQYWDNVMNNSGFDPNDDLGYHNIGAGVNPVMSSNDEYSTGAALMGRLFYSLKDRYMATLSVRRDGYSAFGQNYPWGTFPSAALGWVFTDEPFFNADWLNFGKLRLSYGVNGNRDIDRYISLAYLQTGKYLHVNSSGSVEQVSQLYVNNMPNPNLQWEQTTSLNVGLDFGLFHNILQGNIDVYKSKTTNLLVKRHLPDVTGFDFIWTNLGEVDNKGFELSLQSHNISHPNFSWNTSFDFSLNRNEIVHLYGDTVAIKNDNGKVTGYREADDITNKWFIGHAINAVWDINVLGVYQIGEADQADKYGQEPGDFKLEDVNNDGQYTNDDRQFLGYEKPRFRWSLRNDFTFFKQFNLSFLIYSYWGHLTAFNQAKNREGFPDRTNAYVYPYWTPDNPTTEFARIYSSDGGASYSVYRKRSFIRLANVSLAYSLPKTALDKIHVQALRLYLSVENAAFYAPDWVFWDPEWDDDGPGPTPRTFTFGLNLTL